MKIDNRRPPRLYVAVTDDRFELPVFVSERIEELAGYLNIETVTLRKQIKAGQNVTHKAYKKPFRYCYINFDTWEELEDD